MQMKKPHTDEGAAALFIFVRLPQQYFNHLRPQQIYVYILTAQRRTAKIFTTKSTICHHIVICYPNKTKHIFGFI